MRVLSSGFRCNASIFACPSREAPPSEPSTPLPGDMCYDSIRGALNGAPQPFGGSGDEMENAKTNPLYAQNCCVLMEAGGAPPPVAKRARLSPVCHSSCFAAIRMNCAIHPPSEREGTDQRIAKTNPLRASRAVVLSVPREGPRQACCSNAESTKTNPLYPRNCWVLMEVVVLHRVVAERDRSHPSGTSVARKGTTNAPATFSREKSERRDEEKRNRGNKPICSPILRLPADHLAIKNSQKQTQITETNPRVFANEPWRNDAAFRAPC